MAYHGAKALAVAISLLLTYASAGAASNQIDLVMASRLPATVGGDTNAIIGGDTNAIIGGDTNAIIGGDTNAIIGGDTNAIIGGDRQKAKRPSAIIGGDRIGGENLRIVASGPIDYVDSAAGRVQVLGQKLMSRASAKTLREISVRVASGEVITATVFGRLAADGALKPQTLIISDQQHIPGVTVVMVAGKVQRINREHGTFVIGGLTVDYTPLLANGIAEFEVGTMVDVRGVRHAAGGVLTATAVQTF